jgi:hypothetical protein
MLWPPTSTVLASTATIFAWFHETEPHDGVPLDDRMALA